ncbi:MAG: 16S rRNA (cytosine(1402)-N(4))-methyltransferase RsmH [Cypionkella sp.]|nr:16S rRNA (cytosine(1402)-N(4))-methyltransferase RsmH [Cypionkella sp.]
MVHHSGAQTDMSRAPHIPVLLEQILKVVAPVRGVWLDGTFGAGGYTRGLLAAGAARVIGVDRDPAALAMAAPMQAEFGARLVLKAGTFSQLDILAGEALDGVVLDLGVSSMQIDQAERGFSFQKDGPLDMRMSQDGPSAADIVCTYSEGALADILFHFGEERAARRIARAIVDARAINPINRTLQLSEIISKCLPRPKPGQSHPATRSFQGLRIAVNGEFDQLVAALGAAERALKAGGLLAVVTFHSLEDRVVKRFFQEASGDAPNANRYAPLAAKTTARFDLVTRKAIGPDDDELAMNPRARSAKLRVARRTDAPAQALAAADLGAPMLPETGHSKGRR